MMPSCTARACTKRKRVLDGITTRMSEVGLRLHPEKTRVVYCKDDNRRGEHEHTTFTFLGFAFRAREAVNGKDRGALHLVLSPRSAPRRSRPRAPGSANCGFIGAPTCRSNDLARWLNPIVAGMDELLRPVLPDGAISPPAARQLLPEALGWEEVQAAADLQAVHAVVDRADQHREPGLFTQWRWVRAY